MSEQLYDDKAILDAVDRVHAGSSSYGATPSDVARLAATCAIRLAHETAALTGNLHTAKAQLVSRLDELTTVLESTRLGLEQASRDATARTDALVKWTEVQAKATRWYTWITGGLLLVAAFTLAFSLWSAGLLRVPG